MAASGSHHPLDTVTDDELRHGVYQLFSDAQRSVDNGEATIVVLAARRLACIYQMLLKYGAVPLTGCLVVSDRFLDADPAIDWSQAKVLILDDSVIVGTTLARLHDDLSAKGVTTIHSRAVCLDIDQHASYLVAGAGLQAICQRSHREVEAFSLQLVQALHVSQVPFFSDFPITQRFHLDAKAWCSLLDVAKWSVADVTAPLLSELDPTLDALSLVPSSQLIDRVRSRVVEPASALIDGFKIRLYARRLEHGVETVAVPIALLAPASVDILDEALKAISLSIRGADERFGVRWQTWTPEAKHRLVQLYLSACVLAEYWTTMSEITDTDASLDRSVLDQTNVELYFGPSADAVLAAFEAVVDTYVATTEGAYPLPIPLRLDVPAPSPLLNDPELQRVMWEARELVAEVGLPTQPRSGELTKIGLIFAHAVASVFGYVSRNAEQRQRDLIASFTTRAEYDEYIQTGAGRILDLGLTMRELTIALAPEALVGTPWSRSLISLAIDSGNDLGIVVPITRYDKVRGVVYRCYRIGETAHLADAPLVSAMRRIDTKADAVTRTVDSGFVMIPETLKISRMWKRNRRRPAPPRSSRPVTTQQPAQPSETQPMKDLRTIVRTAVPGVVETFYHGTVTAVGSEFFEAELFSPDGADRRSAQLRLNQVKPRERKQVVSGAQFAWSVFIDDTNGKWDRTSRVRLRTYDNLDPERMRRAGAALAYLAADDEPAG